MFSILFKLVSFVYPLFLFLISPGGIAGIAAETVQHYVQPLENLTQRESVSGCLKDIFTKLKMGLKGAAIF